MVNASLRCSRNKVDFKSLFIFCFYLFFYFQFLDGGYLYGFFATS